MTQVLAHYRPEDALANAHSWDLGTEGTKGRAKIAAHDRDAVELFALTVAFLTSESDRGAGVSEHTLRAYHTACGLLVDWATERGKNLLRLTAKDGGLFREWIAARGVGPATTNLRLAGAKAVLRALVWAEALTVNPWADTKRRRNPSRPQDQRDHYTTREIGALHTACKDARERAIIWMGVEGGLRVSEIAGARWDALDCETGQITVTGKGGKIASVQLGTLALNALRELRATATTDYIFPAQACSLGRPREREDPNLSTARVRDIVTSVAKRAGVEPRGVHSLRHSCGTFLAERGEDIRTIQEHLRHADPSTTARYVKVAQEKLRRAVHGLGEEFVAADLGGA